MEDFIKQLTDMFGEYKDQMENRVYNNMFMNALTENEDRGKIMYVLNKCNEHGISSKALFEVMMELAKEGVFDAKD